MQTRTDLLNYLIERYSLRSYCEIGTQNCVNFHAIECEVKIGVDPEFVAHDVIKTTSDEFFASNSDKFDLFFIDGFHTAEQVKRDFDNALCCLTDNGFIVLHDCLPEREETATHDRHTKQWYGTVWQFVMTLCNYSGIRFFTWGRDCGCCVVWKDATAAGRPLISVGTWFEYMQYRDICLNITSHPERYLP